MKNTILSLVFLTSLCGAAFAQGKTADSAITELRGSASGPAAEVAAPGEPERAKLVRKPSAAAGQQFVTFESGRFDYASDARKALEKALAALQAKGLEVIEEDLDYDRYTIVFVSRYPVRIQTYESREYDFKSDADKAMKQAAAALEASGAAILEQNLAGSRKFVIRYIDAGGAAPQLPGASRIVNFESAGFDLDIGAARRSMEKALAGLQAAGLTVIEKKLDTDRYSITFLAKAPARVRTFESRELGFGSDIKGALKKAAEALEAGGAVILEHAVTRGNTLSLKYIETSRTLTSPYAPEGLRIVDFGSSDFMFNAMTQAPKSMQRAMRGLAAAGYTVAYKYYNHSNYRVIFVAPAPIAVRDYRSRPVEGFGAERAMNRAADALERSGAAVLEAMTNDDGTFSLKYAEISEPLYPHPHQDY